MAIGIFNHMPWKVHKRGCRQKSTDKKGSHAIVKVADDGSEEQESCHADEDHAAAAIRARYANESLIREYIRLKLQSLIY